MRPWLVLTMAAAMATSAVLRAQPQAVPKEHTAKDWSSCERCRRAYTKALGHTLTRLVDPEVEGEDDKFAMSFPAKMVCGWLLIADDRHPKELRPILDLAMAFQEHIGELEPLNHRWNWYPALAGVLLAEHQKYRPDRQTHDAMKAMVAHFQKYQEKTGGWFKSFEGAARYPVQDLGFLDGLVFAFLRTAKAQGIEVPAPMLQRADDCLAKIQGGGGISYGTGQNGGDPTGARGAFAMKALRYAGDKGHRINKCYEGLLPRQLPNMNKGHHIGAFHCLGVVLGCHALGPDVYRKLTDQWLDPLINLQVADGGIYVGDDKDAGGEEGLIGEDDGSTGAAALLILLQDPTRLDPNRRPAINYLSLMLDPIMCDGLKPAARWALAGELDKVLALAAQMEGRSGVLEQAEATNLKKAVVAHADLCIKEAEEYLAEGDVLRAIEILSAVAKIKKHSVGQDAQAALDRINKTPATQQELAAQKALDKAWKAVFAGGMDAARPTFEKVVADFPGTVGAKRAKETLGE